jgi:hypothetical protein
VALRGDKARRDAAAAAAASTAEADAARADSEHARARAALRDRDPAGAAAALDGAAAEARYQELLRETLQALAAPPSSGGRPPVYA